jgi:hypothetical protein
MRPLLLLALFSVPSFAQDSTAWLEKNATLIFHEAFEREEDGNLAKAIGNGWNSATADRVPKVKMADLDDGILKVASASEAAKHSAHIHHEAGFTDGGAVLRAWLEEARAEAQRREIGAGFRLGVTLAPPEFAAADARQERRGLGVCRT